MSETLGNVPEIIAVTPWDEAERLAVEAQRQTSLADGRFEFDATQRGQLTGAEMIAWGAVRHLTKDFGSHEGDPQFRVVSQERFDTPGRTFSGGYVALGAVSRGVAQRHNNPFAFYVNLALEGLNADFRLEELH